MSFHRRSTDPPNTEWRDPLGTTTDPLEWAQAYRFMENRIIDLENGKGKVGHLITTVHNLNNRINALEAHLTKLEKVLSPLLNLMAKVKTIDGAAS